MTEPRQPDDNWAELYRELGVEESEPGPPAASAAPDDAETVELTAADEPAEEAEDEFEPEEVGEGEPEPAGEPAGEGDPGQRKRRRRRRRRKKKGGAPGTEPAEAGVAAAEPREFEAEEEAGAEPEGEESDEPPGRGGFEDEATPEMTRDIIANWNVPSWDEIVAGLYRPDR